MLSEILWISYWMLLQVARLRFVCSVMLLPVRKMVNYVKRLKLLEQLLTVFLCVYIYIPLFVLGMQLVYLKRTIHVVKAWTGIGYQRYGELGIISRKHPVTDILSVSTNEELEFLKYRVPVYLYRMTIWTAREVSRLLTGNQQIELISEFDLAYTIFNSLLAHSLSWVENKNMYLLKMEGFDDLVLSKGFYWEAREVWLNKDGTKMKLVFSNGKEVSWPCSDDQINEWNLAKLHVQVCMTAYPPLLSHNHVHFVFPSTMTLMAKRHLDSNSFLYRLLAPHFQFSERINYQALQNSKTFNEGGSYDRNFHFWQAFPVSMSQFSEGVSKKCHDYYHARYQDHAGIDKSENSHCNFPPSYVTDDKLQEIPYNLFLARYYEVIREFVASVEEFIDRDDWQKVQNEVKKHVPGFEKVGVVEGVATFIHQVAVVHYCDHDTFTCIAYRYGCMAIRTPYEPWTNHNHWSNITRSNPEVKNAFDGPLKLIKAKCIMRTRCFVNVFVDFIPDWSLDLRLISTKYHFDTIEELQEVEAFKQNLLQLDDKLSSEESPLQISHSRSNSQKNITLKRTQTLQLVKLNDIVRTVCF